MKYAIVHIIKPEIFEPASEEKRWHDHVTSIVYTAKRNTESLPMLGDNAAEFHLETQLPALSSFLSQLDTHKLAYRIAFLDSPLDWIKYPKN